MRPVGSVVHMRKGTVNYGLVGWMCLGSVPMAFLGAYLLHLFGGGAAQQTNVETLLGAALLVGTAGMLLRSWLDRRTRPAADAGDRGAPRSRPWRHDRDRRGRRAHRRDDVGRVRVADDRAAAVRLPGAVGRAAGGTDLTQAVPLTAAAALGALAFGHVQFGVTAALVIGSVPAVLVGSLLSSRAPDKYIRPVITFVIFASGLKYAGLGTTALGWTLCLVLLACGGYWLVRNKPWRARSGGVGEAGSGGPPQELTADILNR